MAQPFTHVGQEPGSLDCAFFCGYVVALNKAHSGNFSQMQMSQQDVYEFRNAFLRQTRKLDQPGYRWLIPRQMPSFLDSLGLAGTTAARPKGELQSFIQDIHRKLAQPKCWGALISFEGERLSHWVAILQSRTSDQGYWWICYDPAGNINKIKELCAAKFRAHELAGAWFERRRITSVVA